MAGPVESFFANSEGGVLPVAGERHADMTRLVQCALVATSKPLAFALAPRGDIAPAHDAAHDAFFFVLKFGRETVEATFEPDPVAFVADGRTTVHVSRVAEALRGLTDAEFRTIDIARVDAEFVSSQSSSDWHLKRAVVANASRDSELDLLRPLGYRRSFLQWRATIPRDFELHPPVAPVTPDLTRGDRPARPPASAGRTDFCSIVASRFGIDFESADAAALETLANRMFECSSRPDPPGTWEAHQRALDEAHERLTRPPFSGPEWRWELPLPGPPPLPWSVARGLADPRRAPHAAVELERAATFYDRMDLPLPLFAHDVSYPAWD